MRVLYLAALAVLLAAPTPARAAADPRAEQLLAWIEANSDRSGLPRSHVGDEALRNWTFTYDAAVTALAYLAMGKTKPAKKIIDYYMKTPQVFRLGGVIEAVNPASLAVGEDYGVRTGTNLWLGIAAFHLFRATNDPKYLRFAKLQADFGIALQVSDVDDVNDGAVRLGPLGGGATVGDQHVQADERLPRFFDIISTEHNLDAYALFGMVDSVAPPRIKQYGQARERVLSWIKRMGYNRAERRFNRGAYRVVDTLVATDVQAWAVSALGPELIDAMAPGGTAAVLAFTEAHCVVDVPFTRRDGVTVTVRGADFVDARGAEGAKRPRMVSPEWTFELANAYGRAGDRVRQQATIDGVFPAAVASDGGLAFPYATLGKTAVGHDWDTPTADTLSVIGAAWGILALKNFDPLITPHAHR